MDISRLNQRIQIQKASSKTDEVGNIIQQWRDEYSCFAAVNTEGGKERQKGDTRELRSLSFAVRSCRKLLDLSAVDYRILFREKIYNIVQVDFADYSGKMIRIKGELEEHSNGNDIC